MNTMSPASESPLFLNGYPYSSVYAYSNAEFNMEQLSNSGYAMSDPGTPEDHWSNECSIYIHEVLWEATITDPFSHCQPLKDDPWDDQDLYNNMFKFIHHLETALSVGKIAAYYWIGK